MISRSWSLLSEQIIRIFNAIQAILILVGQSLVGTWCFGDNEKARVLLEETVTATKQLGMVLCGRLGTNTTT